MAPRVSVALCALILLLLATAALASTPGDRSSPRQSRQYRPAPPRSSSLAATDETASPPPTRHWVPGPSQVFRANQAKAFAWFDPLKHQALFGIAAPAPRRPSHVVAKRANGPPNTAPAIPNDNCLGCAQMGQGATWDISTFTVNFFIQNALWKKGDAPSQCLFYSPAYGLDLVTWANTRKSMSDLSPDGGSPRLSAVATNYACQKGMQTIWMTWPGKSTDYAGSQTTATEYNFWEISQPGSWIYPLWAANQQFTFFSHMSQALAEICTGNIYIMSISPLEIINRYSGTHPVSGNPSILTTIELGTLRNRYNTDPTSHDGVGSLIAIDATTIGATQPTMYQLNWDDSLSKVRQISRREVELEHSWVLDLVNATRGPAHKLSARNTCNANVAYENGDWFG